MISVGLKYDRGRNNTVSGVPEPEIAGTFLLRYPGPGGAKSLRKTCTRQQSDTQRDCLGTRTKHSIRTSLHPLFVYSTGWATASPLARGDQAARAIQDSRAQNAGRRTAANKGLLGNSSRGLNKHLRPHFCSQLSVASHAESVDDKRNPKRQSE